MLKCSSSVVHEQILAAAFFFCGDTAWKGSQQRRKNRVGENTRRADASYSDSN